MFSGGLEERIDYAVRRLFRALGNNFLDSSTPEEFSLAVAGVENAVAEEHEHVSRLHVELELVVVGFVEQAERQSGRFDHFILAAMHKDGAGSPEFATVRVRCSSSHTA